MWTTNCTANDSSNNNDLENEMELRMERDGQRVTLRLKKNDNVRDDVPVYTSKDDVVQKLDTRERPVSVCGHIILGIEYLCKTAKLAGQYYTVNTLI